VVLASADDAAASGSVRAGLVCDLKVAPACPAGERGMLCPMATHDVEPIPAPRPDLNSLEALHAATERLRALGIDDEVVFSCTRADDGAAHLGIEPAARASAT
jgi:hypothetical protein